MLLISFMLSDKQIHHIINGGVTIIHLPENLTV